MPALFALRSASSTQVLPHQCVWTLLIISSTFPCSLATAGLEVGSALPQGGLAEVDKAFPAFAVSACLARLALRLHGELCKTKNKEPLLLPRVVLLFTVVHPVKTALKENKNQFQKENLETDGAI